MTFCTKCLDVFVDDIIPKYETCPRMDCGGELLDVDEMIAPAAVLLYAKGYNILKCCSGHAHKHSNLHILFDENTLLENAPQDFEFLHDNGMICIAKPIEQTDKVNRQLEIFSGILALNKWVQSLDDISVK